MTDSAVGAPSAPVDEPSTTRRSFVRKAGACSLGAIGTIAVLGDPPTSRARAEEQFVALSDLDRAPEIAVQAEDGDLSEAAADPFAVEMYKLTADGYRPTAPINLAVVLTGSHDLSDVMAVFEDDGWRRSPKEYVRYARSPDGEWVRQQATAAESTFGSLGRSHVRCWSFDDVVSIQVHTDTPALPDHGIETYSEARDRVERLFAADGWRVAHEALAFANEKQPDHDGRVTVIEP